MKNLILSVLVVSVMSGLSACGSKSSEHTEGDGDSHEEGHDHGAEESGASFKEGKGIELSSEARKALDINVEEVMSRKLNPSLEITAQVYRVAKENGGSFERTGSSYASAFVDGHEARMLKPDSKASVSIPSNASNTMPAVLKQIDTALITSTDKAEIIIEIPDPDHRLKMGEFVTAVLPETTPSKDVMAVPSSAVLDTAAGKFVYVQNGESLLRTPVKTGPTGEGFIEITDGLYEGDTIAVSGAESLYLIELRATKGGGHSH